jgi:branched-chain amino acid transport system permease protein
MNVLAELADLGARAAAWGKRLRTRTAQAAGAMAAHAGPAAARQMRLLHATWERFLPAARDAAQDLGTRAKVLGSALLKARVLAVESARRALAAASGDVAGTRAHLARTASRAVASSLQAWKAGRRRLGTAASSVQGGLAARLRDSALGAAARSVPGDVAEMLRNGPLGPVLARFERWRMLRLASAEGRRYRVEVSTARSRHVALGAALLFTVLIALPAFAGRDVVNDLIFLFTMLALAQYWNLLAGYAGLVSIGQQAFVGLGGYLLFALTIHAGIDPLLAILLAGPVAGLLALPTALVLFRLRGAYFAIGTWVMAEVYRLVFAQIKGLGGGTGTSLPSFVTNEVAGIQWVKAAFDVRTSAARDIITYWAALLLAAVTILVVYLVLRSRHGLALAAIRDSDGAAESVGVDSFRTKLQVYVVTAVGTGMVGALIYLQKARISPDAAFSVLDWTAYVLFIVVIGGIGTIEGPIVGVLIFYLLQTSLAHYGTWYLILLGLLAIVVMLFAPKGIWGYVSERYATAVFPLRRRLYENTARGCSEEGRPDA